MPEMFKFVPYGPFEVPIEDGDVQSNDYLSKNFWKEIDRQYRGLSDSVGCYIFTVRDGSIAVPWYVGRTVRLGFKGEVFQPQKRFHYLKALRHQKGVSAQIYLIPRITRTGKFRKKYSGDGSWKGAIDRLEELLIGSALAVNPDLANVKSKKQIELAGYMNESGERSPSAEKLAMLLRIPTR